MYLDVVEFLVVVAIVPFYHRMTSNEKEQKRGRLREADREKEGRSNLSETVAVGKLLVLTYILQSHFPFNSFFISSFQPTRYIHFVYSSHYKTCSVI